MNIIRTRKTLFMKVINLSIHHLDFQLLHFGFASFEFRIVIFIFGFCHFDFDVRFEIEKLF